MRRVVGQRLARSTALVAGLTLCSQLLGLLRDVTVAAVFGVDATLDAYLVAQGLMNLVLALMAGAVAKAAHSTWDTAVMQVKMIGKMVVGEISLKNVTGPITIADYAGQTARSGVVVFLSFIALISISLGVMNLLPIPVLDGGHLLYYSLEVLTGRPLPARVGEFAQRAGVGILLMLMALAVFNDVVRLL